MSAVVIVGAQWGDEGKGKATDLLGPRVDYVVKPNGGNNAGHTVVVNGQKFELKLLPAGILSDNAVPVIGNGVVVNPEVEGALRQKNELLVKVYNRRHVEVDEIVEYFMSYAERLKPMIVDTTQLLNKALDEGKTLLMEGGQATFLDVDHGTYPFVTSSNPTSGGACVGSGVGPTRISRVIGIQKAYTTRVGAGPFPTELFDEMGEFLRTTGGEFGVNTGRPRRCGWYDAVLARQAVRINGFTDLFITKLDVLTGLDKIPVCVAYDVDGVRHDEMPMTQTEFHHAKPIFEYYDGWTENISDAKSLDELPENARKYVLKLEEISGCRISAIGVGPDRDQTIVVRDLINED